MLTRFVALALSLLFSVAQPARAQQSPALRLLAPNAAPLPPESPLTLRLRFLQRSLDSLARHDDGRILQGSLQLALGAAFGVGAVFLDEPASRSLLVLAGGLAIGRGSLRLGISMGAHQAAGELATLPAETEAQARQKLRFGEAALAHAAYKARRARILDASLGMLGATAFVPLCWAMGRRDDASYRFGDYAFDYVGLSLSVIAFAAALVQSIVKSEAEQRLSRYRELPAH